MTASATAGSPCIPYTSLPLARVSPSSLITCYFNPVLSSYLSEEQTPSGDLHTEAGPNPKLNLRSYANKEDKGKFLLAASRAAD